MEKRRDEEFKERVVSIRRVAKVVKGGRRFAFSALVVAGDGKGRVGIGKGKGREVSDAINKASHSAKKAVQPFYLKQGRTISHEVVGQFGAAKVLLIPASEGTGVIAGGSVRAVLESLGVKDILTKCVGTNTPHNVVLATLNGLSKLKYVKEGDDV